MPDRKRVHDWIKSLASYSRQAGATKVTGTDAYRLRHGDYRIVYLVDDAVLVVTVTRISHRREVCRRL